MADAKPAAAHGKKGGAKDYKNLTGRQKAAIFLVSLGSDVSSEIMKHLREDEVETLTFEIARLETVDSDFKDQVLEEFAICLVGTVCFVNDNEIEIDRVLPSLKPGLPPHCLSCGYYYIFVFSINNATSHNATSMMVFFY